MLKKDYNSNAPMLMSFMGTAQRRTTELSVSGRRWPWDLGKPPASNHTKVSLILKILIININFIMDFILTLSCSQWPGYGYNPYPNNYRCRWIFQVKLKLELPHCHNCHIATLPHCHNCCHINCPATPILTLMATPIVTLITTLIATPIQRQKNPGICSYTS